MVMAILDSWYLHIWWWPFWIPDICIYGDGHFGFLIFAYMVMAILDSWYLYTWWWSSWIPDIHLITQIWQETIKRTFIQWFNAIGYIIYEKTKYANQTAYMVALSKFWIHRKIINFEDHPNNILLNNFQYLFISRW